MRNLLGGCLIASLSFQRKIMVIFSLYQNAIIWNKICKWILKVYSLGIVLCSRRFLVCSKYVIQDCVHWWAKKVNSCLWKLKATASWFSLLMSFLFIILLNYLHSLLYRSLWWTEFIYQLVGKVRNMTYCQEVTIYVDAVIDLEFVRPREATVKFSNWQFSLHLKRICTCISAGFLKIFDCQWTDSNNEKSNHHAFFQPLIALLQTTRRPKLSNEEYLPYDLQLYWIPFFLYGNFRKWFGKRL